MKGEEKQEATIPIPIPNISQKQFATALPLQTIVEISERVKAAVTMQSLWPVLSLWTRAPVAMTGGECDDSLPANLHVSSLYKRHRADTWIWWTSYLLMSLIDLKASSMSPMVR